MAVPCSPAVADTLRLAWRNVLRHRRRSVVAVASIAFGVTALMLASGFIEFIFFGFREDIIRSQFGHLQIVRPGYHEAGRADPYAYLLPDTLPRFDLPPGSPRIKAVAPRLSFNGLASVGDTSVAFIADGVDPVPEAQFDLGLEIAAGRNLAPDQPLGMIMGVGLARNLGAVVGTRVVLLASTARGGTNAVEATVLGLFTSAAKAYDDAALRLPLVTARRLLRSKGAHAWVVLLDDTEQTDQALAALRTRLSGQRLEVVPWYAMADFYQRTVALFGRQIDVLNLIIAGIIVLSISNTMMMSVLERTGEIGTLLALGTPRRGVAQLFLAEGLLLGLLGGLGGLLAGLALAGVISWIGIPMPPPPGKTQGFTAEIRVTLAIASQALALALGTTLLASLYPAWAASRQAIVDALRHNR